MALPSLRRLSLADVDDSVLLRLAGEGEHLFVERKREPPHPPKFGAEIASFANTLGGWLLIGVEDGGNIVGWEPPPQLDLQSHVGNLLRNEVDPVPPYVADIRTLESRPIGVVRVFESTDTPVLVRETGALYVRDSGGKQPVTDYRTLVELARRGETARTDARNRLRSQPLVQRGLDCPDQYSSPEVAVVQTGQDNIRVIVRAGPVTVTPQFTDWPISSEGARTVSSIADSFLPHSNNPFGAPETTFEPYGRGVLARCVGGHPEKTEFAIVADSGGVIAASIRRQRAGADVTATEVLRRDWLRPLIDRVAYMLAEAEAIGASVWDMWICLPMNLYVHEEARSPLRATHIAGELTIPADDDELSDLGLRWEREFAREAGMNLMEGAEEQT